MRKEDTEESKKKKKERWEKEKETKEEDKKCENRVAIRSQPDFHYYPTEVPF